MTIFLSLVTAEPFVGPGTDLHTHQIRHMEYRCVGLRFAQRQPTMLVVAVIA